MKKLISMVAYVLENIEKNTSKIQLGGVATSLHEISSYAKFLQQKPTLGMFVPAILKDGKWIILEKPNPDCYRIGSDEFYKRLTEFEEAEQRVIFEGFEVECVTSNITILKFDKINTCWFYIDGQITFNSKLIKTIEDLVPYNLIMK